MAISLSYHSISIEKVDLSLPDFAGRLIFFIENGRDLKIGSKNEVRHFL